MSPSTLSTSRRATTLAVAVAAVLLTAACEDYSTTSSSAPTPVPAGSAAVKVATTDLGETIVNADGRVIYLLTSDKAGDTSCRGSCLQQWPPVLVTGTPKATGVTADLGTLSRGDDRQLTIAGHPAYTYAGDSTAGEVSGQGKTSYGGTWWVIAPDGSAVTGSGGGSGDGGGSGYGGRDY